MMTYNAVLSSLIEGLNTTNQSSLLQSWDVAQTWPVGALDALLKSGILATTSAAKSLECQECEYRCFSDVIFSSDHRAFIICEEPEMQNQMGKIAIHCERLKQWKTSVKQLAYVIADLLNFEKPIIQGTGQGNIRLGMLKGTKGRRWVSLNTKPLSLEINDNIIPMNEILFFENEKLVIDRLRIDELINSNSSSKGKTYVSSIDKREASKRKTQTMYHDWKEEYLKIKKKNPEKSDTWCSQQIAKMDIAQKKDSETIRKNMK